MRLQIGWQMTIYLQPLHWERGRLVPEMVPHILGEGTPRPQNVVASNGLSADDEWWWQMVADGCR